jgi:aminodeoxyfutalosine deaminase
MATIAGAATRPTDSLRFDGRGAPGISVLRRIGGIVYPKIELHVHLEATVTPQRLLEIARRNDQPLPAMTVEGLRELYRYRDFDHFIEIWTLTTNALRRYDDFREIVVDYAAAAHRHGAVYIEGIFSPIERHWRGVDLDEVFAGYCDGAQEALERHGVEVRLTPDITRGASLEDAATAVRYALNYRDRGVVGIGLGGEEHLYPPEPFAPVFRLAKAEGLASVPHAGEVVGVESVRGAMEALAADRIRHGIRAGDDPGLLREIADRHLVLDVCPISNLRTGAVRSLAEHPLPHLVAAGVLCSVSTDDPEMFDTDLTRDYAAATSLGLSPRLFYEAGVEGAVCDTATKDRLRSIGHSYEWSDAHTKNDSGATR